MVSDSRLHGNLRFRADRRRGRTWWYSRERRRIWIRRIMGRYGPPFVEVRPDWPRLPRVAKQKRRQWRLWWEQSGAKCRLRTRCLPAPVAERGHERIDLISEL